jgi:hypothetical protein
MRLLSSLTLALGLLAAGAGTASAEPIFSARLRGNVANQSIAGFPSSRVTWDIERGRVSLVRFGEGQAVVVIRTQGLIIPALGRNPSPDLLARLVCHDAAGAPSEAARTRAVPFPEDGDATLIDVVAVPGDCFAPIVLLTGSRDPDGNQPGNWFAVSGF